VVGLSHVALSQGIALFHRGDGRLRSKSMDSNSHNLGDYFNRIFWVGSKNNFGAGAGCGDTTFKSVVALFNANKAAQNFAIATYVNNATVSLHPHPAWRQRAVVKGASFTPGTATFSVPARTTAVFVET
jgi:pullulanase/glycogen debranching enzyme